MTSGVDPPESLIQALELLLRLGGRVGDRMASGNMNAVEFSKNKYGSYREGSGPWVAADLEAGVHTWNGDVSAPALVGRVVPVAVCPAKDARATNPTDSTNT